MVTTVNDELNSHSDCSLREAIQAATTNAAVLDSVLTMDGSGRNLTVRGGVTAGNGGGLYTNGGPQTLREKPSVR